MGRKQEKARGIDRKGGGGTFSERERGGGGIKATTQTDLNLTAMTRLVIVNFQD